MTPRFTFLSPRSAPGPSASIPIAMRAPTMWSADLLVVGRRRLASVRLAEPRAVAEIGGTGCDVNSLLATRCSADPGTGQRATRNEERPLLRRRRRHDLLRQRPRVQYTAASNDHVLTSVELVHNRTIADATDRRVPECRAVTRAQGEHAVRGIAREGQAGFCRQHAGAAFTANVVLPLDLAALIVDCAQHALGVNAVIGARPPVRS